jgi:hypothetical protein
VATLTETVKKITDELHSRYLADKENKRKVDEKLQLLEDWAKNASFNNR